MAPHSNTLAWKIPWTEEPGRLQSMGSLTVGHDSGTSLSLFTVMHWRKWEPTPVLLPGESHGRRSLVGCSPWGREELDTTEWLHFPFSLSCTGEGNGNPLQCSCLENPRDGRAWWTAVYGVAQGRTRLKRLSSSNSSRVNSVVIVSPAMFKPWNHKMRPMSLFEEPQSSPIPTESVRGKGRIRRRFFTLNPKVLTPHCTIASLEKKCYQSLPHRNLYFLLPIQRHISFHPYV